LLKHDKKKVVVAGYKSSGGGIIKKLSDNLEEKYDEKSAKQ